MRGQRAAELARPTHLQALRGGEAEGARVGEPMQAWIPRKRGSALKSGLKSFLAYLSHGAGGLPRLGDV